MIEDASSQPRRRRAHSEQHTPGALTTSAHRTDDVYASFVTGELDLATVDRVAHELQRAEATDARSILIDLSSLTFMDSTGIQLMVAANSARARTETACAFVELPPACSGCSRYAASTTFCASRTERFAQIPV